MDKGAAELFAAVKTGDIDWLVAILSKKTDPDGRDGWGRTPLHLAALLGETFLGEILVLAGADPDARNTAGNAPIHLAAEAGQARFCAMLLDNGAKPNLAAGAGSQTAMHMAAGRARDSKDAHGAACMALVAGGADPSAKDARGKTPIDLAREAGNGLLALEMGMASGG